MSSLFRGGAPWHEGSASVQIQNGLSLMGAAPRRAIGGVAVRIHDASRLCAGLRQGFARTRLHGGHHRAELYRHGLSMELYGDDGCADLCLHVHVCRAV